MVIETYERRKKEVVPESSGTVFFSLAKLLKERDMFGKPIPAFNVRGKSKVNSMAGGLISLIIMIIMFLYSTLKF